MSASRTGDRSIADALHTHGIDLVLRILGESYLPMLDILYGFFVFRQEGCSATRAGDPARPAVARRAQSALA